MPIRFSVHAITDEGILMNVLSFLQLLAATLLLQTQRPVPINGAPLDVCTVLKHLQDYGEKFVMMRGRWDGDAIEGDCVVSTLEEKNRFGVPYSNNSIVWVHPYESFPDITPDWIEDPVVEGALKTYDRLNSQGHNVQATFIGKLEVIRSDLHAGYGHMGTYRAQLVLVSIKNVVSETGKPVREPPKTKPIDR
jgi:hypothetical protein